MGCVTRSSDEMNLAGASVGAEKRESNTVVTSE